MFMPFGQSLSISPSPQLLATIRFCYWTAWGMLRVGKWGHDKWTLSAGVHELVSLPLGLKVLPNTVFLSWPQVSPRPPLPAPLSFFVPVHTGHGIPGCCFSKGAAALCPPLLAQMWLTRECNSVWAVVGKSIHQHRLIQIEITRRVSVVVGNLITNPSVLKLPCGCL